MKRTFKKDDVTGHLCLVTEVEIDKEKELLAVEGNIAALQNEADSLLAQINELKKVKAELEAIEG